MRHLIRVLAAILVALTELRLRLHLHLHAPPTEDAKDLHAPLTEDAKDENEYVHDFHLKIPREPPPARRLICAEGSASHTARQSIAPAPKGAAGMSHLCEAERGHVMTRADVDAGARSAHEAVAAASSRERTVRVQKRVREALGAAIEDALPLLHGGASYASDEQREGVHLQRGDAREDGADVVRPPRVKVARRRFLRRMSAGNVGSNRAGSSR